MTFPQFRATAILLLLASQSFAQPAPRIAIIIDDLGYQVAAGHRAVALPGPVACACGPFPPPTGWGRAGSSSCSRSARGST